MTQSPRPFVMIMLDGFACGHTAADAGGEDLRWLDRCRRRRQRQRVDSRLARANLDDQRLCRNIALQVRANQVRSERKVAECELALCVGCGEERRGPDR